MQIFKGPSKIILSSYALKKYTLIQLCNLKNDILQSVGYKFGNYLDGAVKQGDGPKITCSERGVFLEIQRDEGSIDALYIDSAMKEILNQPVDVLQIRIQEALVKAPLKPLGPEALSLGLYKTIT